MSSAPTTTSITPEEYLERERKAETKSEYFRGEIFAMAGASRNHGRIVTNLVRELSARTRGRTCNVYSGDLRVAVGPIGLYTYPDVVVVCGEEKYLDGQLDTLLNPTLIVEVLSESTKDYDRGQKFQSYRALASVMEYLAVAQDKMYIEQYARQSDGRWILAEYSDPAASDRAVFHRCGTATRGRIRKSSSSRAPKLRLPLLPVRPLPCVSSGTSSSSVIPRRPVQSADLSPLRALP